MKAGFSFDTLSTVDSALMPFSSVEPLYGMISPSYQLAKTA